MTTDSPPDDPAALTTYIETRFHQSHRDQLPDLAALALRVERVHADHPEAPHGLGELLHRLIGALEVHMKKEELILFPAIRRGGDPMIGTPIAMMRDDHSDHGAEISRIRSLTNDLSLPDDACRSWTALYDGLASFISDLETHVRLEDEVLFPRFDTTVK